MGGAIVPTETKNLKQLADNRIYECNTIPKKIAVKALEDQKGGRGGGGGGGGGGGFLGGFFGGLGWGGCGGSFSFKNLNHDPVQKGKKGTLTGR